MSDVYKTVDAAIKGVAEGQTEIWLKNGEPTAVDVRPLLEALKDSTSVTKLWLRRIQLGHEGAALVVDMLQHNSSITELGLRDNSIGDVGAVAIAEMLKENSSITDLTLDIGIGDAGAVAIAEGLKENSSITELGLSYNSIGDAGAAALAVMIKENSSIRMLNLTRNSIGDAGAVAIAEGLKENSSIRMLYLMGNSIGDAGAVAIAESLKENSSITELFFDGNDVGSSSIESALARNKRLRIQFQAFAGSSAVEDAVAAAMKNGDGVEWRRVKLALVGNGAAGKTSTLRSLLGETPVAEHISTVGAALKNVKVDASVKHTDVDFVSQDLSDVQYVPSMRKIVAANAVAAKPKSVVSRMFGKAKRRSQRTDKVVQEAAKLVASRELFDDVQKQKLQAKTKTKTKTKSKQPATQERQPASPSAPTMSFSVWDYGGQEVFYLLHHLFLTSYAMYLVVFDMELLLDDSSQAEELQRLTFWLRSVQLHAAGCPVFLVGTREDQVSTSDLAVVDRLVEQAFAEHFPVQRNEDRDLWFFPLDNMSTDVDRALPLRKALNDVAGKPADWNPFVERLVSARWMHTLHTLLNDEERSHYSLEEVRALARETSMEEDEEVDQMLDFFHELGMLVHLKATPALRDMVVTQPQWMLDNLTKVLCDDIHRTGSDWEGLKLQVKRDRQHGAYERLYGHTVEDETAVVGTGGEATRKLLDNLWHGEPVDFLLDLMEDTFLACDRTGDRSLYLVPSLLPVAPDDASASAKANFEGAPLCWLQFAYLPKGVFQRLVCGFERHFKGDAGGATRILSVFASEAELIVDGASVLLQSNDRDSIVVQVGTRTPRLVAQVLRLVAALSSHQDAVFFGTNLKPTLLLSADGSQSADHAAEYETVRGQLDSGADVVASHSGSAALPVSSFGDFFDADAVAAAVPSAPARFDVFVSYCWADDTQGRSTPDRVGGVVAKLRDRGLRVFHDKSHMRNDVQETMANGIRDSSVCVVFVTQAYMDKVNRGGRNNNVLSEYQYIVKRRPFVPVVLEPHLLTPADWPEGLFDFLARDELFVALPDDAALDAAVDDLQRKITDKTNQVP